MPTPYVAYTSLPGTEQHSDASVEVPVIGEVPNDWVIIHVFTMARGGTVNTAAFTPPAGWEVLENSFDATFQRLAIYRQITGLLDTVTITNYSAESRRWFYSSAVVRDALAVSDTAIQSAYPSIAGAGVAMDVTAADSLVLQMVWAFQNMAGSISAGLPAGWTPVGAGGVAPPAPATETPDAVAQRRVSYQVADADTGTFSFTVTSSDPTTTGWDLYSFTFDPTPTPARPTTGDLRRLSLNCADSYTVWLTDSSYSNTIDRLGWSAIAYERVLDDISTASVTVPDELGGLRCSVKIPQIENWEYGILIERNDQQVWRGPITGIARVQRDGTIRLTASDPLIRQSRNLVIWLGDKVYNDVDSGAIFTDIINVRSRMEGNPFIIDAPVFFTGEVMSRTLRSRRLEFCWTVLQELLDSTIDAFMANGLLYCWSPTDGWVYSNGGRTTSLAGPYNAGMDLQYGTFTNESFVDQPDWTMSGMEQANYVATPTADAGDLGFRKIYTAQYSAGQERAGVLVFVDPNTLHRPENEAPAQSDSALQRRADTVLALRANAPAVITNGSLAVGAPIDFDNLWPGSLWDLDYWDHGYGQLLTTGRLNRIAVNVALDEGSVVERVVPTLHPIGYAGS